MKFTPGQLRSVTSISQETYRHWKKSFPDLEKNSGKKACFSAGDLLAVLIIRQLTQGFKIQVSALSGLSQRLFSLVNSTPWFNLERSVLLVNLPDNTLEMVSATAPFTPSQSILVLPLAESTIAVRNSLLMDGQGETQGALKFSPFKQTSLTNNNNSTSAQAVVP